MNERDELEKLTRRVLAEGHETRAEFAMALVEAIAARFELVDREGNRS